MSSALFFLIGLTAGIWLGIVIEKKRAQKNYRENIKLRVLVEDALKKLYFQGKNSPVTREIIEKSLHIPENKSKKVWDELLKNNLLDSKKNQYFLSKEGAEYALQIIRAHRLWEQFLAQKTGYPAREWHQLAEYKEHFLSPEELAEIERSLGYPLSDPHGDPIPSREGILRELKPPPPTKAPLNTPLKVVHIEDEPQEVYQKLLSQNIFPGELLILLEKSEEKEEVQLLCSGKQIEIDRDVAENIFVQPVEEDEYPPLDIRRDTIPLSELKLGETAEIAFLSPAIFGLEKRRLLDLGILPGTKITPELTSPLGDPRAYRVRDSLIALRREQAEHILVYPKSDSSDSDEPFEGPQINRSPSLPQNPTQGEELKRDERR